LVLEDEQSAPRRGLTAMELVAAILLFGVIVVMGVLLIGHLPP
jgi:hypothetical protein